MTVKHVLVVDDSKSARFMLRKMLGKINLTADLAESGEEAITYLQANQPDAIFMDYLMPGLNGLETVEKIKTNPQTAVIPVVMYSSQGGDEYEKNVKSHGILGILPKPATSDNLNAVIRTLNDLSEIPLGQIVTAQQASNDEQHISAADIEKMVRKTAEAAVTSAVRYQVIGTIAQQLSQFKQELKFCDETKAEHISETVFDKRFETFSSESASKVQASIDLLTTRLDDIANSKISRIDNHTLEEIKRVASLSSMTRAVESATETAETVANEYMRRVSDAINDTNTQMTKQITIAAIIASVIGIASALTVYLALS